jgi:hypothetical protein
MKTSNHDSDFYTWTQEQAALLRHGQFADLDLANLIEEIEDMGVSERRELESRLIVLLAHLLKWVYQSERRGNSWEGTIRWQRSDVQAVLRDNPGLKPKLPKLFEDAYSRARLFAMKETGLPIKTFPIDCPWSLDQGLDDEFWPE